MLTAYLVVAKSMLRSNVHARTDVKLLTFANSILSAVSQALGRGSRWGQSLRLSRQQNAIFACVQSPLEIIDLFGRKTKRLVQSVFGSEAHFTVLAS